MICKTTVCPPVAHLVGPGKLKHVNGRLVFSAPQRSPVRLDLKRLKTLVCYGSVSFSDQALQALLHHGVETALMSGHGFKCHGRLIGQNDSSALLRIRQHDVFHDSRQRLMFARHWVLQKIESQRQAVRHYQRHSVSLAGTVLRELKTYAKTAQQASSVESLRGSEGAATARWFQILAAVLNAPWTFPGRNRRPPRDPVNSLLSLSATWLLRRTEAQLRSVGLEITLGTLHEFHHGRPSLACDVVEPLRVAAADRWVIRVCNEGHLRPDLFRKDPERGVYLPEGRFGEVLHHWENHWAEGELEKQLKDTVDWLCRQIRQLGQVPNPGEGEETREGLGRLLTRWHKGT